MMGMKKWIAGILAVLMIAGIAAGLASAEEYRLTREEAIRVALEYAELAEEQVAFTKVELDWDDGHEIWEIEFVFNGIEYELDIDAHTGRITEADAERYRDDDWDDNWLDRFDFD